MSYLGVVLDKTKKTNRESIEGDVTPDPLNHGLPRGRRKRTAMKGQWTTPPTRFFSKSVPKRESGISGIKRKNSPSSGALKRSRSSENLRNSTSITTSNAYTNKQRFQSYKNIHKHAQLHTYMFNYTQTCSIIIHRHTNER